MSKTLHVIGVDPGLVTGMAYWTRGRRFEATELKRPDVAGTLRELLMGIAQTPSREVFVGVQRYRVNRDTHKKSAQPDALEVTGVVETVCSDFDFVHMEEQAPSLGRRFKDPLLRRLGIYQTTRDGHANDATRHLLVTLLRYRPYEMIRIIETGRID